MRCYLDDNANFEAVDIANISIDEPTGEAITLFDLLPSLPQTTANFKLKEPIKDKKVIEFIRLIYEASKRASKIEINTKLFCFKAQQASEKLKTDIETLKNYMMNDINVTIVYFDDGENFGLGRIFEAFYYDSKENAFYISLITTFADKDF